MSDLQNNHEKDENLFGGDTKQEEPQNERAEFSAEIPFSADETSAILESMGFFSQVKGEIKEKIKVKSAAKTIGWILLVKVAAIYIFNLALLISVTKTRLY